MLTKVLIIGGGLSGLHTAYECRKQGIEYCLIEARDRLGGRILSLQNQLSGYKANESAIDLGPSWFWPGQQRILSLINELGLNESVFNQSGNGSAIYEDQDGNIQRDVTGISMTGAYRLKGGIRQLTSALADTLDNKRILLDTIVTELSYQNNKPVIYINDRQGVEELACDHVVLAMPPRVALATIKFSPMFSEQRVLQLNAIATWMAGHAKLVCEYENKFWQQAGYSGDVVSHKGPLQEIHDASSEDGKLNALFGFVGIAPIYRQNRNEELKKLALSQLTRLFGVEASQPLNIYLQDWSTEKFTATKYDQELQRSHPTNNIAYIEEPEWNNQLIWSGTEAASYNQQNNGFLEGALEASEYALSKLV